jgi:hypothetical protein
VGYEDVRTFERQWQSNRIRRLRDMKSLYRNVTFDVIEREERERLRRYVNERILEAETGGDAAVADSWRQLLRGWAPDF